MPSRLAVEKTINELLARYNADIDVVVFGGDHFKKSNIFAFVEDLREALGINADVFEISEVDNGSPLYENLMNDGIKILCQ